MLHESPPLHGCVIAWEGRGVLILGAPGIGKSSLALECINHGAQLVADDAILLRREGAILLASAPQTIKGHLALRELGIIHMPFLEQVPLALAIQLGERLARDQWRLNSLTVPCLHMPRDYPARLALIRQSLFAMEKSSGMAWLPEDWHPMQRSA
jgi:hypothetical protein